MEEQPTDARQGVENSLDLTQEVAPVAADETAIDADLGDSPTQEPEELSADDSAVEPDKAPSERTQKRIQRLVSDKKAAMEYGDFWRKKYEEEQGAKPAASAPSEPDLSEPKIEDFDYDHDAWAKAVINYNSHIVSRTVEERLEKALAQRTQAQTAEEAARTWRDRVLAFSAEHDDFEEVVSDPTIAITQDMATVIQASEQGPALAYHLGNNPDVAARIATMPPSMQAFELGKIEISLAKSETPKAAAPKKPTQAPAPMSPVSGQQPSVPPANESMEDYVARRWAETQARKAKGF